MHLLKQDHQENQPDVDGKYIRLKKIDQVFIKCPRQGKEQKEEKCLM